MRGERKDTSNMVLLTNFAKQINLTKKAVRKVKGEKITDEFEMQTNIAKKQTNSS